MTGLGDVGPAACSMCGRRQSPGTLTIAAVRELVRSAERRGNHADATLPTMDDWKVAAAVAAATGVQAQTDGVAHLSLSRDDLYGQAIEKIETPRFAATMLMKEELIAPPLV